MTPGVVDSPLRRSILLKNAINNSIQANDDNAERNHRRSNLMDSYASSAEDSENLKMCLKLYADNKITKDNAWKISVIDTFSKMIEKHHKELRNFQVAGSTLEASSRVYSLRVDSVHSDVIRMCSELTRQTNKSASQDDDDSMNDTMDGNNMDASIAGNQSNQPKKKVKKQRHHISTITKNKETINGKLETYPFPDPFFAKLNSIVGDINSSNRLMQNIIPTSDAVLKLGMNSPCWDPNPAIDPQVDVQLKWDDENIKIFDVANRPTVNTNNLLHPSLAGYVLSNKPAEEDEEDKEREAQLQRQEEEEYLNSSQLAVHFDTNADVEPIPTGDPFIVEYHGDLDEPFEEMTEEDRNAINACRGLKRTPVVIEDMRPINATSSNLEYSYRPLDMIDQYWAGPSHWKFRRTRTGPGSLSTRQATVEGQPPTAGARKKPRKKPHQPTKLTLEDFEKDVDHLFVTITSTKPLKNVSLRNWSKNAEKLKLPTDFKFDRNRYYKFKLAPGLSVRPENSHINLSQSIQDEHVEIDETETESGFGFQDEGPQMNVDVEMTDATSSSSHPALSHGADTPVNTTLDFIPTEYQGAPERVTKINIPYAKTAKVVDMKLLKLSCWRLINEKSQPNVDDVVIASGSQAIPESQPKIVSFHDIRDQLPKVLTKNMADSISTSLAFYSILHLANERGLKLEQETDLKDFSIQQLNLDA